MSILHNTSHQQRCFTRKYTAECHGFFSPMATGPCGTETLVFRLHESTPEVVREVLLERGWEEHDPLERDQGDWNLYWRTSGFRKSDYQNVLPWQRLNHHPNTMCIARKDCLVRNLRRMRCTYGATLYGFSPTAFILPNDYTRFLEEYAKSRLGPGGKRGYWICKPVDLSRGRGIFIFDDIKHLTYDSPVIVQKYISNPLLISGYKLDLRIYVCVKSFSPLTIYTYQEGLVRFATEKYDLASLDNLFSHLTNTSINKFGPFYTTDKERVGQGCKWTMGKFRTFLHSQGINELLLWQKINNIVTLTLLTIAPSVPSTSNCLELFGFDILIDSNFKPWLLEVNYSPALSLECPADVMVKKSLVNDLIDLMNYTVIDSLRKGGNLHQEQKHPYSSSRRSLMPQTPLVHLIPKSVYERKLLNQSSNCYRQFASNECKLPAIHTHRVESSCQRTQERNIPSLRVGDFILTFPFNDVTRKASQGTLDVKTIVREVRKLKSQLRSSQARKENRKKERNGGTAAIKKNLHLCFGVLDTHIF
ncbi:putative tubulin polyglutamylase TTLL2 [Brachyhypopomus gauderio]|uniref:putative tubulin polyglutamylase TTLL2 n=1 Tax=Brachyhypopomus gauderio TaxID=698409 RepID=UPI0040411525